MASPPPDPNPVEIPNCLGQSTIGSERIRGVTIIWYGPVEHSICSGIPSSERVQGSATVVRADDGTCRARGWASREGRRVERAVSLDSVPDLVAAQQVLREMYGELLGELRKPSELPPEVVAELGGSEVDGKPEGYWVGWDAKKEVVWRGHYVDGKWHGRWVGTDLDGKERYFQTYKHGVLHGPYQGLTKDGEREQGQYVDGLHDGVWTVWAAGQDGSEWKSSQRTYKLGRLNGPYKRWRPDGGLWISVTYRRGKKHGEETVLAADGSLRLEIEYDQGKVVHARGPAFDRMPESVRAELLAGSES